MGGVGTTLGLTLAMVRSDNTHVKSIGKLSLLPAIFNINEPIMFGTPIVMNPLLFVPFIMVPIINGTIAWFATKYGLVSKIVTLVPWTTPGPLAALLATNLDISAAILSLALVLLSYFIYTPFLKLYTRSLNESEV